ncbi:tagaturonate epimerase [Singulisphaera sp. GP187]|uniref:tagaturonate epimerase family protein n=1 Tax=Singulisphaera sp. GP187 TaxID=1882752 RepID=UPI00092C3B5A|nr:tagaturonate epimerase family protein [Singulisphaera sp. GP187]SIO60367.1 tagaturonate epimerase [Singulisphaera sp. GP187]
MTQRTNDQAKLTACVTLGLEPSFGFGDRIGLATPGHVAAMHRSGGGIQPIFPQQSIREMARTGRTPQRVMNDALGGMRAAGWNGRTGADADHLKTTADVDATAAVGFTFFTIDPSDSVDAHADDYGEATLRTRFAAVAGEVDWVGGYQGKTVGLATGTIVSLDEQACLRAAVKYGRALNHAIRIAEHIARVHDRAGRDYEIELSVDETEQPTTLAEHFIIADQCLQRGMKLISLAPRYIGDLEKGVDYKGDVAALEHSLHDHAAIATLLGPYKLSLHSGSDKLSMYAALARATRGRFHVKTAGTSYLEALRVVARHDVPLFRRLVEFARGRYETDRATYHVSATLRSAPPASEVAEPADLERLYLESWADVPPGAGFTHPGRQILHCTFGSTLTDPTLGPAVRETLERHPDTYTEVLADHFSRHLEALRLGM